MEGVGQSPGYSAPSVNSSWFRLYLCIGFSVVVAVTLIVSTRVVGSPRELLDVSEVSDLFSGNTRQVALARGFTCVNTDYPATLADFCTQHNTKGMVSSSYLQISSNRAEEVNLSLRENMLTLGDLMLLWGNPNPHPYCETLPAWSIHQLMVVVALPRTKHIDYFTPILYITFLREPVLYWQQALLLDTTHGCLSD